MNGVSGAALCCAVLRGLEAETPCPRRLGAALYLLSSLMDFVNFGDEGSEDE